MTALAQHSHSHQDQDLQQRVKLFLGQQLSRASRRAVVEARRGVVTLTGLVPTYYERQLIGALTRRVAGVVQVDDRLEVAPVSPRTVSSESRTLSLVPA